jgi:hypothetical protein
MHTDLHNSYSHIDWNCSTIFPLILKRLFLKSSEPLRKSLQCLEPWWEFFLVGAETPYCEALHVFLVGFYGVSYLTLYFQEQLFIVFKF